MVERIVTLIVGLLLGLVIGWILRGLRREPSMAAGSALEEELRQQALRRESEANEWQTRSANAQAAAAAAEASRDGARREASQAMEAHREKDTEVNSLRLELAQTQNRLATATAESAAARASILEQQRVHEESERSLKETHAQWVAELRTSQEKSLADLKQSFAGLSAEALKQNGPEFLRLANETFTRFQESAKGDLSMREQRIESLVKPLEDQLKAYQARLQQSDSLQSTALGEVRRQVEELSTHSQTLSSETHRLRAVLSSNQARGRWGEETLRRVVEASGMSAHCDFVEQVREGDSKPDLIVRLPGERVIIVDSKVPDLEFLAAVDSEEEGRRSAALADHAAKMKSTIKALADRDYPAQFNNALDHVVLFVPAESLFSAALEGDRDLIVWAAERHILLATPASLIALLRSVAVSWQAHEQSQNAQQIAEAAQTLYERVNRFVEHFERIRDGLSKTTKAYDDAVGSYERMVRPSGERLARLGGGVDSRTLPEIRTLDTSLRQAPENRLPLAPSKELGPSL
jgi:DNA recombination protein RmuC